MLFTFCFWDALNFLEVQSVFLYYGWVTCESKWSTNTAGKNIKIINIFIVYWNWVPYGRINIELPHWRGGRVNRLADRQIWPKIAIHSWISLKNWTDLRILQKRRITDWLWNRPRIADFECFDAWITDPKLAQIVVFWSCSEGAGTLFPLSTRRCIGG